MEPNAYKRFGRAWIAFAIAIALHVTDEATRGFLPLYNANVQAIRARFPLLPIPTFTFLEWILGLGAGILLLFCLTPKAMYGARWIRTVAFPLGIVIGIANGTWHILYSLYMHRLMPGVISAPLIIAAGIWLLVAAKGSPSARYAAARQSS